MRSAFATAVSDALRNSRRKPAELARALDVSDDTVRKWAREGMEPKPRTVFAIELLLECEPGSLSRHLGYEPVGVVSVAEAIESDGALDPVARRMLLGAYQEAVRHR